MSTSAEEVVRAAYRAAEGDALDADGFRKLFTEDGVLNNVVAGETYVGDRVGDLVLSMGRFLPDVHRELHRFHVQGDLVTVELSIRGTFAGPFETPAGVLQPTGAKVDFPTADFWYVENGKIKTFNCYAGISVLLVQLGVYPDFASAINAPGAE
ncbi:ester cyclase [Lentzea sp. NPDC059081]|uniref:ester cyclase n=1 Tax=Lentzea sp. NPDC059081 TaxID=3346719 RepID=UPI003696FC18